MSKIYLQINTVRIKFTYFNPPKPSVSARLFLLSHTKPAHMTEVQASFTALQDDICRQLSEADGQGIFREDKWERPGGGGGRTRIIEGKRIEKGGVNFSAVWGDLNPQAAKALGIEAGSFFATGVSIVMHPVNPLAPIIHMNVRYFETGSGQWWYGGGIDLTPHYIDKAEARWFHQQLQQVCHAHHPDFYHRFKTWADDYFFLAHRQETRGVGGIFFDRLNEQSGLNREQIHAFVMDVGRVFAPTYCQLLTNKSDLPFSAAQKEWQYLRRGRYVEFNLVWDRGTRFGLETDGRTESILMSLPPQANWAYNHRPAEGSAEADTLRQLQKGIDWLSA